MQRPDLEERDSYQGEVLEISQTQGRVRSVYDWIWFGLELAACVYWIWLLCS